MKRIVLFLTPWMVLTPLFATEAGGKGLFFAAGAGMAVVHTHFDTTPATWSGHNETDAGVAAAFKLGYGITDQIDLYVTRTSSFVYGYDADPEHRTYGNCITALGINYYPSSKWYGMAAVGQGQLSDIGEDDSRAEKGWGFLVGVGYELFEHVHLEASYVATRVDDDIKLSSDTLHVTVSLYLY